MQTFKLRTRKVFFVAIGIVATALGPGCFQTDNNEEFKRNSPASPPPENPDMPYSEQRASKRRVSKAEQKAEAREKAALEKAAAKGQ